MRSIIILILISSNGILFSQDFKFGIINDADGYTNLRAESNTNSEVLSKIFKNEIFIYYIDKESNWFKVIIHKCPSSQNYDRIKDPYPAISGFVHKSRIMNINELDDNSKKELIQIVLLKEIELYELQKDCETVNYHEMVFNPLLKFISNFICNSKNEELLKLYIELISVESGSADESPSFTLGELFLCMMEESSKIIKDSKGDEKLVYKLEWGVVPHIDGKHDDKSLKIKKELEKIRLYYGLEKADYDNYY